MKFSFAQNDNTLHYVKKGETVYQIARKYNVNPKQVLLLNPNASDLIQIGQELIIPDPQFESNIPTAGTDEFIDYLVVRGDTKFQLSQRFSVSIAELERLNPQMVPTLLADSQIRVPKENKTPNISNSREGLKTHLVVRGETLYGIARQYGISLSELIDANVDRLGTVLLAGQYLEIPSLKAASKNISGNSYLVVKGDTKYGLSKRFNKTISQLEAANPSMVPTLLAGDRIVIPDDNSMATSDPPDPDDFSKNRVEETKEKEKESISKETSEIETSNNTEDETTDSEKVTNENSALTPTEIDVLLSFTKSTYDLFSARPLKVNESNPLTAQQEEMLNFQGLMMAMDSLAGMNYNSKINVRYAISDSIMIAEGLYNSNKLILAPDFDRILENVKLPSSRSVVVTNNFMAANRALETTVFISKSQGNSSKDFLLDHLRSPSNNVIIVSDPSQLEYLAFAKAKDNSLKFITESNTNRTDEATLESLLLKSKKNFVVFNTDRDGIFINVTNALLKLSNKYNIQTAIVDQSYLPSDQNVSTTRFKILKMIYPEVVSRRGTINNRKMDSRQRLIEQGFNTAYDLIRKFRNFENNGGDFLNTLKGDQREQIEYIKMASNRYGTGSFKISQY
jgi:LysM repeat protein